jgi:CDP-diacylglycerol--glycerol-3-phosphate 3-phosphatidyltransferase
VRIGLIPFILQALRAQLYVKALLFFVCAAATDLLDGMLARILKQQTTLGALLDPFADKLLIGVLFIFFTFNSMQLPFWFFIFYCIKESLLVLGALYVWVCFKKNIKANNAGKSAMFLQTVLVGWLLLLLMNNHHVHQISDWLIITSACVSMIALFSYGAQAFAIRRSACVRS